MLTQKELSKRQHGYIDTAPDSMPTTKIRAFMEEFPWIKKNVRGPIVQAYVSRVEPSILNYSPEQIDVGFLGPIWISERILLLDERYEEVTAITESQRKKFFFFGPLLSRAKKVFGVVFRGFSVGSVARQLEEKADSVHFLLSYYGYTKAVIIYRLPKGLSLRQWIEGEVESERQNLRKEFVATI